jgi:hypothetical protein
MLSMLSVQRRSELLKCGHGHSKLAVAAKPIWQQHQLKDGNNSMFQKVANELMWRSLVGDEVSCAEGSTLVLRKWVREVAWLGVKYRYREVVWV